MSSGLTVIEEPGADKILIFGIKRITKPKIYKIFSKDFDLLIKLVAGFSIYFLSIRTGFLFSIKSTLSSSPLLLLCVRSIFA